MILLDCILIQVLSILEIIPKDVTFCKPNLFFFSTSGGKERGDKTRTKCMGEGPATQDYQLVMGNICKAIHALQLH